MIFKNSNCSSSYASSVCNKCAYFCNNGLNRFITSKVSISEWFAAWRINSCRRTASHPIFDLRYRVKTSGFYKCKQEKRFCVKIIKSVRSNHVFIERTLLWCDIGDCYYVLDCLNENNSISTMCFLLSSLISIRPENTHLFARLFHKINTYTKLM